MMSVLKEASEFVLGISLFINACLFIPQSYRLYRAKDANGVSLITFGGFVFIDLSAMINGIFFNNWAMIIGYGLSTLTCSIAVVFAIYYRCNPRK